MANENVNDDAVKQAAAVFDEIATSAASIESFCFNMGYAERDNVEALNSTIEVMRTLVARIGWLGDLGSKKLTGSESIKGDAEQWMMSPVYVADLVTVEVGHD